MLANADRRAHIIIMTMADDGWWCAYLCTYLYTVWFDDSKCTVECDDVGTFVGVVAEVDGRIQRLVSHDQYWYVIMLLFVGRFAANAHWQRRNTRTNARNCAWQYFVLFTAAADHHSYIYLFRLFSIYMFSITAAKFCFSSRTCVWNSTVVSHMCGTHKNQLVFGARSGIWNDCAARGDKVSVNAAYAQHCVRVHRSKQTTHTHTKWPVFLWVPSVTTLRNVFNVLYIFLLLLFFSSCTDAR